MESSSRVPGSDATLLDRVRSGDSAAIDELRARHASAARLLAGLLAAPSEPVTAPWRIDEAGLEIAADSWHLMLSALHGGGGPRDAFRPHLLAIVTTIAGHRAAGLAAGVAGPDGADIATAVQVPGPGEPFVDVAGLGRDTALMVLAFLALPESWTAVLWHTEVELAAPSQVAPLLGMTAAATDLTRRARSALRSAYLRMYLNELAETACREAAAELACVARGELSRHSAATAEHLRSCDRCRAAHGDVTDLGAALRRTLAPIVLGGAAEAYCAMMTRPPAAAAAPARGASRRPPAPDTGDVTARRQLLSTRTTRRILVAAAGLTAVAVAVAGPRLAEDSGWSGAGHPAAYRGVPTTVPAVAATSQAATASPAVIAGRRPRTARTIRLARDQRRRAARQHQAAPAPAPAPAPARAAAPAPAPARPPAPAPRPTTARPAPSRTPRPPRPVVLLSQDHPVTASSEESYVWAPKYAVDGSTNSRWSSEWSDPQWLRVDLGATHAITKVVLDWEDAYGTAFQIQTSENGSTWTTIYSTTTGPGGDQVLTVRGTGRYVRMYGTHRVNGYGYSLWEFQVFGR
jgi:F5/8 type C domain